MLLHIQRSKSASALQDAAVGGGAGALVGMLSTLFKKEPSLKDVVKRTLVGGGAGAALGAGLGGLRQGDTPAPSSSKATPQKPKLDTGGAALAGVLPGIGPAIYGAAASQDGDRISNAIKLGVPSFGGGHLGRLLGESLGSKGSTKSVLLGGLASVLGSAGAAGGMADLVNKSGSAIGNLNISPLNPAGGAMAGGVGGAALGGGVGLVQALMDGDDDGIMGTIRKALQGAAVGGVGGAALGGTYSALRRNNLLNQLPNQDPKNRGAVGEILGNYKVPVKSELNRIIGGDPNKYRGDVNSVNSRASVSHAISPALVRMLEQKSLND